MTNLQSAIPTAPPSKRSRSPSADPKPRQALASDTCLAYDVQVPLFCQPLLDPSESKACM